VIAVAGSWNSRVISSSVDGTVSHPACWREEQVLGTDLHSCLSAVHTLSLLLPTFPQGPHTNFLYGELHVSAPEQKMFRDWTGPTLFQAETVPEKVLVLSLLFSHSFCHRLKVLHNLFGY